MTSPKFKGGFKPKRSSSSPSPSPSSSPPTQSSNWHRLSFLALLVAAAVAVFSATYLPYNTAFGQALVNPNAGGVPGGAGNSVNSNANGSPEKPGDPSTPLPLAASATTAPNPTAPNPTAPNPTTPNPTTAPNPTTPNPTTPNPTTTTPNPTAPTTSPGSLASILGNPNQQSDESEDDYDPICQGIKPAQLVFDRVVPVAAAGGNTVVTLRNIGGQTVSLKGWRLTNGDTRDAGSKIQYVFGSEGCAGRGNFTLDPTRTLTLTPQSESNPCGFAFPLTSRDEVNLFDLNNRLMATARWVDMPPGSALKALPDGNFIQVPETAGVVDLLERMGMFKTLLSLLKDTPGMVSALDAPSSPDYKKPEKPKKAEREVLPQFPWWFGFGVDRSKVAPPPPPPPPAAPPAKGIPSQGPYTILAPTDDAFEALFRQLGGGGKKLTLDNFKKLPELPDILLYHILPGLYATNDLYNNTPIYTAMAVELTPFNDPCMTEGKMMLHDNCIDKPTPDQYTCEDQVKFDKCYFPFMTSALAAQWQGGFCQRTCQRCSCAADSGVQCAQVMIPDAYASNGMVQTINRVLFPPPHFTKEMYANMAPVNITADMSTSATDLAKLGMTSTTAPTSAIDSLHSNTANAIDSNSNSNSNEKDAGDSGKRGGEGDKDKDRKGEEEGEKDKDKNKENEWKDNKGKSESNNNDEWKKDDKKKEDENNNNNNNNDNNKSNDNKGNKGADGETVQAQDGPEGGRMFRGNRDRLFNRFDRK